MSEVLLSTCESRIGITAMQVACSKAIRHVEKLQYVSCISSIKDLCVGTNYLKLYFI